MCCAGAMGPLLSGVYVSFVVFNYFSSCEALLFPFCVLVCHLVLWRHLAFPVRVLEPGRVELSSESPCCSVDLSVEWQRQVLLVSHSCSRVLSSFWLLHVPWAFMEGS